MAIDWPISALWVVVPAISSSLAISPVEVGLIFTVLNLGAAVAYLPAGFVADHSSAPERLLKITLWWVCSGIVLAAAFTELWTLTCFLLVTGMGNAAWHPVANVLLAQHETDRARAIGIHGIGGSIAEVAAPAITGLLLLALHWRVGLLLCVGPTLIMAVVFAFSRIASVPHPRTKSETHGTSKTGRHDWNTTGMLALIGAYNMAFMSLLGLAPLYLTQRYGLNSATLGITISAMLMLGAFAQPVVGHFSDRQGRKGVLLGGNIIAALSCITLSLTAQLGVTLLCLMLAVASLDSIRATALAAIMDRVDDRPGTALGAAFTMMEGVGALGILLAGYATQVAWHWAFAFAAAACATAALLAKTLSFGPSSKSAA